MKLVVVSVNQNHLNMDQRESFHFRESDKLEFSTQLIDQNIDQSVILSTCNRSEVYIVADDLYDQHQLKDFFLNYFHKTDIEIDTFDGIEALSHLLKVACGLKSMVIGEDQILHQIREAYEFSKAQKFTGKEMNYIFQTVLGFASTMRSKYAISEHPLSVSYIGYQWLLSNLKENSRIMICGIGEMSQLMLEYLKDYEVFIVNRTQQKVEPYLNEKRHYVPFDERYDYLNQVDIIISATSSPHYVIKEDKVPNKPFVFLDLAMPRDIDVKLKERTNCQFADMDDLQLVSNHELQKRQEICLLIENEIDVEKQNIFVKLNEMKSDSLIQKMQTRYLDISEETFELLKNKLDLTQKEEYVLKKVLKTSFLRLLKDPVRLLKTKDTHLQEQYIQLVSELFDLND